MLRLPQAPSRRAGDPQLRPSLCGDTVSKELQKQNAEGKLFLALSRAWLKQGQQD